MKPAPTDLRKAWGRQSPVRWHLSGSFAPSGYRTLALTNFPRNLPAHAGTLSFPQRVRRHRRFGEEHLVKPDPEIYRRLCSRYGVEPARSVFIDDSAPNVAGALNIGMHALRFSSPENSALIWPHWAYASPIRHKQTAMLE